MLGGLAAVAAAAFHAADPAAALLLLPFVGWTCFATALVNCALASGDAEVLAALGPAPAVLVCTGLLSSAQRPGARSIARARQWECRGGMRCLRMCYCPKVLDQARRMFPPMSIMQDVTAGMRERERGRRRRSLIWPVMPRLAPAGSARRTEPGGAEMRRDARRARQPSCRTHAVRRPGRDREGAPLLQERRCISAQCPLRPDPDSQPEERSAAVPCQACMQVICMSQHVC